jgi:hypothetical protein
MATVILLLVFFTIVVLAFVYTIPGSNVYRERNGVYMKIVSNDSDPRRKVVYLSDFSFSRIEIHPCVVRCM